MTRRYSFPKRLIAMLLSIVMIASFLPSVGISAKAAVDSTVSDAGTMDSWTEFFPTTGISTEHAGGIWTDKSVFTKDKVATAFPSGVTAPADGNFLVALSALGSNSIVVGSGTKPTDTVFVLDISGSMANASGAVSAMVKAANDAIRSLMAANDNNRVGVVLYSDSGYQSNENGVRDGSGTVLTLLPLDHYTGVTWNSTGTEWFFIADDGDITTSIPTTTQSSGGGGGCNGGGSGTQTVNQTPVGDNGGAVTSRSVTVVGGTYIQGGLWQAWEDCFDGAMDGQATGSRTPSIVLMSDGAPTFASTAFDNVNVGQHTNAHGNYSYDGDGFLAQLTASVVKGKVAAEYGTTAYMYTVGFALDNIDNTRDKEVASAVLEPMGGHRENIDDYWDTYNALATNAPMNITVGYYGNNSSSTQVQIHKSATAVSKNYVDKFFSADDASSLSSVFQNIVNEINLRSGYYPTRLDDNGTNHSGYVTFVDEIGTGMEVENIRGILVGDTLYTGEQIARILWNTDQNRNNGGTYDLWLGTPDNPTALGDEFVWAVMKRIGITQEQAWALIGNAWTDGQLSCTVENNTVTSFSNYIGWYGDASGNYVAPWKSADIEAPAGAEYINMCYGMVGTTSASSLASDMMYVTIQVSHKITTDEQIVTFRIPASLLPTVTYRINVTLDDNNQIVEDDKATIEYVAADPIRLVYEVGVNEDLVNEITIAQYGTPAPAGSADAGKYYLYTNQWHAAATGNIANDHIAYSYFEASEENEHYYFTEATPLYTYDGTNYTLATGYQEGTTYYYRHRTFVASGTPNSDGAYAATFDYHYGQVDNAVAAAAAIVDGTLTVAKGTIRKNLHSHDAAKDPNTTDTYVNVRYQIADAQISSAANHHYELVYLGNNGRITFEPATGISLTKNMVSGVHADGVKFPFTIETDTTGLQYTLQSADGTLSGYTPVDVTADTVKVEIEAGQTLYVTGMNPGAAYSVTEDYIDGYKLSSSSDASGTASDGTLKPVIFTNDEWDLSFLSITKQVTYNGGVSKPATLPKFEVVVTLRKANHQSFGIQTVMVNGVAKQTDANGQLVLQITDGQVITIDGLPVGTYYIVDEQLDKLPAGYTALTAKADGQIDADGNLAALENEYTPDPVEIKEGANSITITGTKTLVDGNRQIITDWNGMMFTIVLQHYVGGQWLDVSVTDTVTQADPNYSIRIPDNTFDTVGDHLVRVVEQYATLDGVTYDTVDREFRIKVTDDHVNGKLVMTLEEIDATVGITTNNNTDWIATTDFTNIFSLSDATLTLQALKSLSGREMIDGEFAFTLTAVDGGPLPGGPTVTELNSKDGAIHFPTIIFNQNHLNKTYTYRIAEVDGGLGGITYDKTVYEIEVKVGSNAAGQVVLTTTYTKVKDAAGNTVSTAVTADTMTFANTYKAEAYTDDALTVRKTLEDHTSGAGNAAMPLADWDFSFTLSGNDENQTKQNDDSGIVTFEKITYTAAGTYTYTITENDTAYKGVTKDGAVFVVTIVVADNGKGSLYIASKTITRDGVPVDHIEFRNIYKAVPPTEPGGDKPGNGSPVEVVLSGMKFLENAAGKNLFRQLQKGEFSFELKDAAGNVIETVTNGNGTNDVNGFSFSALKFDALGEYTYTISEVKGIAGGVSYSDTVRTIKITVTDETKDGVMEVKVDGAADIQFVNTYDVSSTTLDMTASKHLSGRPMIPGEFSFTLTALNGAPMPAGVTGSTVNAANVAGGAINFGTITYSAAGEYQYTIHEILPDGYVSGSFVDGVKYDENVYTVTVTVEDKLDGTLYAYVSKVEANGTETTLDIHNRYEIHDEESVDLEIGKVVTDSTSETPKTVFDFINQFSFVLTDSEGNVVQTKTNNGCNGDVIFDTITYTAPALEVYWIEEVPGTIPGMTYDGAKYRVTIEITDNGLGGLDQSVVYEKLIVDENGSPVLDAAGNYTFDAVTSADFENKYAAEVSDPLTISGNKYFPGGRDIVDGEFEFILTKPDGSTETKGNVGYVFSFDPITYTKEGTYVYTLVEKLEGITADADGNYIKDGVKYDPTEFTITVTVTDEGGKLVTSTDVKQTGGTESLTNYGFTNVFIPETVTTTIEVDKALTDLSGEALGEAGFVFELYRVDNGVTLSATSNTEGKASFGLTFNGSDVGNTYEYHLSEDDSAAIEGMTYDPSVHTIFITVNQDSTTGALSLEVKRGTEALTGPVVFVNIYDPVEPTTEPETTVPPTTTAPETSAPETTAPETSAPETTVPETTVPETTAPETSAPETSAPETTVPETTAPETTVPETTAPETTAPETSAPETTVPETSAPETTAPETTVPETTAPETSAPETSAPETTVPETTVPDPGNGNPQTNDTFALGHWSAMMGISAICLLAVLVLGKKHLLSAE